MTMLFSEILSTVVGPHQLVKLPVLIPTFEIKYVCMYVRKKTLEEHFSELEEANFLDQFHFFSGFCG